jgi:phosphopantothenoylcysteine decarboxylase/phosphopantothenate--cysteine ligase
MITESAREFVSELVLETLTGQRVGRTLWGEGATGTEHIEWARWPDVVLMAPATAQSLARLAHGLADDFVSTVILASRASLLVAPAMNTAMWENPATQENLSILTRRGVACIAPDSGALACGESGLGKLPEIDILAEQALSRARSSRPHGSALSTEGVEISSNFSDSSKKALPRSQSWKGRSILITAGPTRTALDAVRYITNPSTGLMGKALAEEALRRGAQVHYILGIDKGVVRPVPATEDEAQRLALTPVLTASQMLEASLQALPQVHGVLATAAVMDYEVAEPATGKLKRSSEPVTLHLVPSVDVLAQLKRSAQPEQWFLGFAAETDQVAENGARKLEKKGLDFVFANPVARLGEEARSGFGTEQNSGFWIRKNPSGGAPLVDAWPSIRKAELAAKILDAIADATERASASP